MLKKNGGVLDLRSGPVRGRPNRRGQSGEVKSWLAYKLGGVQNMAELENMNFADHMVEIGGVQTHVYIAGEGSPLLWLHGAGGVPEITPFFQELARSFKVYIPEHPGFGRSERPEWLKDYTDYNYFYRDFLDYYSLDKVNLVGHSLGGRIAMEFAVSHPERVEKLALISSTGLKIKGEQRPDIFMMYPEERVRVLFHNQELADRMLNQDVSEEQRMIDVKNTNTHARLEWEKGFNPKFPRLLRYIKAPTRIIWGDNDRLNPIRYGQALVEHIAGARLDVIENCGHLPQVEQPDSCLSVLTGFLRD